MRGRGLGLTSPQRGIPLVAEVNGGSGVFALPAHPSGTTSSEPRSRVGCFFFFFPSAIPAELRPDLPVPVYDRAFGRQRFSEAAELVPLSVPDHEAAGCVRAGRARRRQGNPVLQDRGGKTDGEGKDNENIEMLSRSVMFTPCGASYNAPVA